VALGVPVLGIEPAANVAAVAEMHGVRTEVALFGVATARKLSAVIPKAELMIANNVLAHVPDIRDFLSGFRELLSDEGVATFEFPHVLNLIEGVQFDTIYHEHIFYFSLYVLDGIMTSAGLRVFDVEELATHGGSLRLFVCHQHARHEETERPSHIRMQERARGLHRPEGYVGFSARILETKAAFLEFVRRASAGERVIAAYGAAAKGSTFLNVCGVKHPVIQAVFDRAMSKQGKLTPGSHIPILAPNQLCEIKPDYLLILPWNLKEEIIASMPELRHWGGQFVTAVPDIRLF
jgi:hypothetical protein